MGTIIKPTKLILDLDNCISNDGWRRSLIKWHEDDLCERYHNYHMSCHFDEFCNRDLLDIKNDGIIIFTGRPSRYYAETKKWLQRNNIKSDFIRMRADSDSRSSVEVKREMVNILSQNYNYIAYDDRQEIVDMYIENGISAEVKKINNYEVKK